MEKKGCDDFLDKIVSTFENPSTRQVEENKFMAIKPTYIVVRLKGQSSEEYNETMNNIKGLIDVFKQENQEYNQKNKEICVGYIV